MATITSAASGLASATTTWSPAQVPIEGDKVNIAAGHTVTLDGTFVWGDDVVTSVDAPAAGSGAVNVNGTLKWSRTVNSSLTVKGTLLTFPTGRTIDMGTPSDPIPDGITAELLLNKATTAAVRRGIHSCTTSISAASPTEWSFCGTPVRTTRGVNLAADVAAGATSATLASSTHGWKTGDVVGFVGTSGSTQATDEYEERTVTVAGATISWTGGLTYAHLAGSPVLNLTANVLVRSFSETNGQSATGAWSRAGSGSTQPAAYTFIAQDARFQNLGGAATNITFFGSGQTPDQANQTYRMTRCVVINTTVVGPFWAEGQVGLDFVDSVYVRTPAVSASFAFQGLARFSNSYAAAQTMSVSGGLASMEGGFWYFRGGLSSQPVTGYNRIAISNAAFSGYPNGLVENAGGLAEATFDNCDLGATFGWRNVQAAPRLQNLVVGNNSVIRLKNCLLNTLNATPHSSETVIADQGPSYRVVYENKDRSPTTQEIYTRAGLETRDNATRNRSNASVKMRPIKLLRDQVRTRLIPCASGASVTLVGYCQADATFYNGGGTNWTAPTVVLSGLGITPITYTATAAANGAWEKFTITATNTSGVDGDFTLTYTVNSKAVLNGSVFFDGIVDAPFVTQARHYGYVFNEANPILAADPYTVATEAAALAYTGVTVATGTSRVTFGAGTVDTFAELYDYVQAWGLTAYSGSGYAAMPWTRAGSTLLLNTGWVVVDPTILGMTWSGGTIEFTSAGIKSGSFASTTLRFTAAGTYNMGGCTFAGTITLTNTSPGSITVQVPSGTTVNNTDPATITVQTPTVNQSVTVSNLVAGSRVQVYDTTNSVELANGIAAGSTFTWTDPSAAVASRAIRVRAAFVSGTSAQQFLEAAVGSCGITSSDAALSFRANQTADTVYNANAIDGSLVTGITIDDSTDRVSINIAGGSVSWASIYAYQCHWNFTLAGIRDDGAIITASDTANYTVLGFKIKNTHATVPLKIIAGYGRDASGGVDLLYDTTGGFIFPLPEHVVAYQTSGGVSSSDRALLQSAADNSANIASGAAVVSANVIRVTGRTINGTGTAADPWGP